MARIPFMPFLSAAFASHGAVPFVFGTAKFLSLLGFRRNDFLELLFLSDSFLDCVKPVAQAPLKSILIPRFETFFRGRFLNSHVELVQESMDSELIVQVFSMFLKLCRN